MSVSAFPYSPGLVPPRSLLSVPQSCSPMHKISPVVLSPTLSPSSVCFSLPRCATLDYLWVSVSHKTVLSIAVTRHMPAGAASLYLRVNVSESSEPLSSFLSWETLELRPPPCAVSHCDDMRLYSSLTLGALGVLLTYLLCVSACV